MQVENKFHKGLQKDLSISLFQKETYWDMLNMRLVTSEGLSTGNPENIKGNLLQLVIPSTSNVLVITTSADPDGSLQSFSFNITTSTGITSYTVSFVFDANWETNLALAINSSIPFLKAAYKISRVVLYGTLNNNINQISNIQVTSFPVHFLVTFIIPSLSNLQICGWEVIRDEIFLLTCSDPEDTYGQIWKFVYDKIDPSIYTLSLIYNNLLNLSLDHPIANPGAIQGNYEGNSIIRLYWTNNFSIPKVVNTADPNLMALDPGNVNIQPLVNFSIPILQNILNGSLLTGLYQYAYRLKLSLGGETVFSQLSSLIPLTAHPESSTSYIEFTGDASGIDSDKSLQLSIQDVDTTYDRIEIISLYYPDFNSIPIIEIIKDDPVPDNGVYTFTHVGTEIGIPVTLDEFNIINTVIQRAKTLTAKNNLLFVGGVKESIYDVQWDARAYRFNSSSTPGGQISKVKDISGAQILVNQSSTAVYPDQWGIQETHDAINPNQDITSLSLSTQENNPYIYQQDGITFGGSGPNVNYSFFTEVTDLDDNTINTNHNAPTAFVNRKPHTYIFDNFTRVQQGTSFFDFHSPYLDSQLKGYTRGETYRFGIVLFDLQGNQSYAKWIADIQFPHAYMPDVNNTPLSSSTKHLVYPTALPEPGQPMVTRAQNLGIRFIIQNLPQGVSGFSIVRCERKSEDKKVLGQGIFCTSFQLIDPNCTNSIHLVDDGNNSGTPASPQISYYNTNSASTTIGDTYATLFSPEHLFGTENFHVQTGDKVELIGKLFSVSTQYRDSYVNAGANNCNFVTADSSKIYSIKNYQYDSTNMLIDVKTQTGSEYNGFMHIDDTLNAQAWSLNPFSYSFPSGQPIYNNSVPRNFDSGGNNCFRDSMNQGINTLVMKSVSGPLGGFNRFGTVIPGQLNRSTGDGISGTQAIYLTNYIRNVQLQYGGNSYSQRADSEYISTGHYQKLNLRSNQYTAGVFGGDTFISIFDIMNRKKHFSHGDGFTFSTGNDPLVQSSPGYTDSKSTAVIRYFPVETTVNIDLRGFTGLMPYTCGSLSVPTVKVPNKTDFDNLTSIVSIAYADTLDEFIYDQKYSRENNTRKYFPKPVIITSDGVHDTRIRVSQQKTNNEGIDSWTIFKEADYLDADTTQGSITNLIVHQDRLVCFQQKGISIASVNERSLIQDNQGADLVLGTGGVLTRFDYISKIIGSEHQFSFTQNQDSVYFFDIHSKALYDLKGNTPEDLSIIKGLSSYFNNNLNGELQVNDNPYRNKGVTATYDFVHKEALFSFKDTITTKTDTTYSGFTIVYNNIINSFETFYSFIPSVYVNNKRNFWSPTGYFNDRSGLINNNLNTLWRHNSGDYGRFYDLLFNSSITMIINPNPESTKIFDNYELSTRSINPNGDNEPNDTFDLIQLYNDYQFSGSQTLSNYSKRVERTWNIAGLRNIVRYSTNPTDIFTDIYSTPYPPFLSRFRDKYLFLKLDYLNTNNNKLILNSFNTIYRKSDR